MENNGYSESTRKFHRNSKVADVPLNVNNFFRENSSQSNQYNRRNLNNRKEYTICRLLHSDSGTTQVLQTGGHRIPQYDPRRCFGSDDVQKRLKTKNPEHHINKFWLTSPENPGKTDYDTPTHA